MPKIKTYFHFFNRLLHYSHMLLSGCAATSPLCMSCSLPCGWLELCYTGQTAAEELGRHIFMSVRACVHECVSVVCVCMCVSVWIWSLSVLYLTVCVCEYEVWVCMCVCQKASVCVCVCVYVCLCVVFVCMRVPAYMGWAVWSEVATV